MIIDTYTGHRFVLHTDGACLGNPGPGGWGVIIHEMDGDAVISRTAIAGHADGNTTNNRMEAMAAYEGLKALGATSLPTLVISDSQLLVNGFNLWMHQWKAKGWRKADRKPVANLDLWMALEQLASGRNIAFRWTEGHAGNPLNEAADMLASNAARGVYDDITVADLHPDLFA